MAHLEYTKAYFISEIRKNFRVKNNIYAVQLSIILFMIVIGFLVSILPISLMWHFIPLGHNEGWNAYNTQRAMHPDLGLLYPDKDNGLIFNNYPPISYYIVGLFDKITFHDYIFSGRLINLISIFVSVLCISMIVIEGGGSLFGGVFSGILVFIYSAQFFTGWFAENDPQWLSIAFQLLAVVFTVHSKNKKFNYIFIAGILVSIGFFIKHNEVSIILFLFFSLLMDDRKKFIVFLLSFLFSSFVFLLLFYAFFGYNFFYDVFLHPRVQILSQMSRSWSKIKIFIPFFLVSFFYFRSVGFTKKSIPLIFFVVFSFLSGCYMRSGDGVAINVHLDALVAFVIIVGKLVGRVPVDRYLALFTLSAFVLIIPTERVIFHLPRLIRNINAISAESQSWKHVIQLVSKQRDPVACRMLSICYWAGKPFTVDFFNMGQYLQKNGKNHIYSDMVRKKAFSLIQYQVMLGDEGMREEENIVSNFSFYYKPFLMETFPKGFSPSSETLIFYKPR